MSRLNPPALLFAIGGLLLAVSPGRGEWPPAPVDRTGQGKCYSIVGDLIPCPGSGQDGDWRAGIQHPIPRFAVNQNGTVTDILTGLVWLADADCNGQMTWTEALEWAHRLSDGCVDCGGANQDCGLADGSAPGEWRLPNIKELQSLVTLGYVGPALPNTMGNGQCTDGDPFTNVSLGNIYYHSSTTDLADPPSAFAWDIFNGTEFTWSKGLLEHGWAVRGQSRELAAIPAAAVEKTGQTTCFAASGLQIGCHGTGQDGELQAGIQHPTPRFVASGNGTVKDLLSGLVWLQDANCNGPKNWWQGLSWANRLFDGCVDCGGSDNDCGLSDGSRPGEWRLPNIRELQTLSHFGYTHPALTNTQGDGQWTAGDPFTGVVSNDYASSTTYLDIPSWNLYVSFAWGFAEADNRKTWSQYVWPVRGGPIFAGGFESGTCELWSSAVP